MPQYIAFLRAINVGGHTVKMDLLRSLFEAMGFGNVQTFIASGNVIFESPSDDPADLEAQIEQSLKQALGYEVGAFVRSPAELQAVSAYHPFSAPDSGAAGSTLSVLFMKAAPDREVCENLLRLACETDLFRVHEREVYWLCHTRTSDSSAGIVLGKTLGKQGTMRNVTTVRKLAEKLLAAEGAVGDDTL